MSRRTGHNGKVDANQTAIADALRAAGVIVRSLAGVGDGMNDLLCIVPQATFLIECKVPGEKLTPLQLKWHKTAPWRNHIAFNVEQALAIVEFYRDTRRRAA